MGAGAIPGTARAVQINRNTRRWGRVVLFFLKGFRNETEGRHLVARDFRRRFALEKTDDDDVLFASLTTRCSGYNCRRTVTRWIL